MRNDRYILKNTGKDCWDIYPPGKENTRPVLSLKCNQKYAEEVNNYLSAGEGIPANLLWTVNSPKKGV